jgi:hypothetical protein
MGSKQPVLPEIMLNNCRLEWHSAAKHLGNTINTDNSDYDDVKRKRSEFIAKANAVTIHFKHAAIEAKRMVFVSKCCALYGSQLWSLDSRHVNEMHTTWRKAVRRLLDIPRTTRSILLPYLMKCRPLPEQLAIRFLKLIKNISLGDNLKLQWILKNCVASGNIMRNITFISQRYGVPPQTMLNGHHIHLNASSSDDNLTRQRAEVILDFLLLDCDETDNHNAKEIAYFICTY